MSNKQYDIFLDNNKIGTTELEFGDPPMGVVFGQIHFINIGSIYEYLKSYCLTNDIKLNCDEPEDKLIFTGHIPKLKVVNENDVEISGVGTNIEGMDSDIYNITVLGVQTPSYEEEFPHHIKRYNEMFKDK